jgi:hypothetical protein
MAQVAPGAVCGGPSLARFGGAGGPETRAEQPARGLLKSGSIPVAWTQGELPV